MVNFETNRTFSVGGPALPDLEGIGAMLHLSAMRGTEQLSTPYTYELWLTTPDDPRLPADMLANLDLEAMLGKELTVTIQLDGMGSFVAGMAGHAGAANRGAGTREISGIVTAASYVDQLNRQCRYRVVLEPWLALARERTDYRIFQRKSVLDILREVFGSYLYSFEMRVGRTYRPLRYQVQYGESDFAFAQRLMEEHGIAWFFEHSQGVHRLVLVDGPGAYRSVESVAYQTLEYYPPGQKIDREHVDRFEATERLRSGVWTTDDFDFEKPGATLTAQNSLPRETAHNQLERYEWPGDYTETEDGQAFAQVRMEEIHAQGARAQGEGNLRNVVCGTTFVLAGHPMAGANREYLVIASELDVKETGETTGFSAYAIRSRFTVQPSDVVFRPPRTIRKPRTRGPQTAIVTGPAGAEIWTNKNGEVTLKFHWDRSDVKDQNSSCWVRVSYPWAGSNFGGIHVPRVGTEVIVDFENGDPDRPIVTGRVYNAMTMPPWTLPAHATQSGILTRSTKGGGYGNANAIRFEDKKGAEQVWIQAERNLDAVIEADETHTVGHDRTKRIGHDETDQIGRHWTLSTGGYKFETVTLASVKSVGMGAMFNVGMAYNVNVGGLYLRNVGLQMASTVGRSRTDRVVQDWTADVGHTYTLTVRGKAVGDAVAADQANPIEPSPDFAPQLPAPVSSSNANQLRIADTGESSLSGAKQAQLIGPGGTVTIDESGIHLKGTAIYLQAPTISMTNGNAGGLAPVTEADCAECAKKSVSANPVDLATGQKLLSHTDFTLPGRVSIDWSRSYRSADQRRGSLGVAWKLPYATEVRTSATGLIYFDADGRQLQFPALNAGEAHFHPIEKFTLMRGDDNASGATYALRFGNGVEEHYGRHPVDETRWQLQRITTRDGQCLTLGYTAQGWFETVRNNVHTVRCALDDAGRITSVLLDQGVGNQPLHLTSYVYDEHGDLVEATDRENQTWRYGYDNHLLTTYRTPAGATHVSEWSDDTPNAYCLRTYAYTEGADGQRVVTREMRFDYLPSLRATRVTDGLGHTTEYHYNGLWAVEKIVHPDGSVEQTHFDETGSVAGYTDALGRTTRMVNDARGNPTSIIDPAGNVTRISYGEHNLPEQIADPAGQIWQRGYDAHGHLTSETDPLGNVTRYVYENGLPVARTDALGNVTKMQWDDAGQLVARTDCSGHATTYDYDPFGQLTETTDALGQVSHHSGSVSARVTAVQPAGMGWWKVEYDEAGRAVAHTDPLKRVTRVDWDGYGQRTQIVDPAGGTQQFRYDAIGRLTKLTNANRETTTFRYDSRDRLIEQTGFDGRRQSYRYNAAGELVERIDHGQDGQITTHVTYDVLGRPVERRSSDGSQASYRYDERGLLTQAQAISPGRAPVQVTYEYDAAGRRTAEVQAHHGRVWRLTHGVDAIGNRDWTHVPDIGSLVWQRYGSGHVHGILLDEHPLANFERDALHREIRRTQGPASHHLEYGANGLLAVHRWQNLDERGRSLERPRPWRAWAYDAAGQLTTLDDAWRDQKAYRYDALSRLTHVMAASGPEAFHYDPAGNLLAAAPSVEGMQAWKASGDRLLRFAPQTRPDRPVDFTYDGHGNRIARTVPLPPKPVLTEAEKRSQRGTDNLLRVMEVLTGTPKYEEPSEVPEVTRYRYDGSHQLIAIEHADGARSEYEYDALGRRVAKHHTPAGGAQQTTLFMWDGDWMMQEVRTGRTSHEDMAVTYVPHPDHEGPLTRLADGQAWHYVTDHLGTPQELYDEQREVVWAADLSAYGRTARWLTRVVDNPIRFPGQYRDEESGLHYNRFRYYDPMVGRYINQDPIAFDGGIHFYSYADSAPNIAYDPKGLFIPLIAAASFLGRGALGGAVEIAMQGAKQVFRQAKNNWIDGRPLTDIDWNCVKIDWSDVGVSVAVGVVAPSLGATRKSVTRSIKAIRNISNQSANTANRAAKLKTRIDIKRDSIKRDLIVQGAWQGIKQGAKCAFGEEKKCEEE
ncbi:type VI secretion system tip protein TssI/VgrG [Burkholderia pseudomultivorans]|uniref:type VI secretion system tip protein TssI/VgrG n=1 Tax=Burkholderia pseudomultivorans TaxID=1207504 RepID=UPI000758F887|nr:type VI secretion system tip protein TssI/VgrG [Burkholderia pseudomultivorans]KVG62228.1 type VI secretion protein ImpA [Burkholderia pseudomultivorans]